MVPSANSVNCDVFEGSSLGNDANRRPTHADIRDQFKSYKKMCAEDPKKKIITLVPLLVVFANLPFQFVDNPWFKALVWFTDPSFSIPTLRQLTEIHLPALFV